MRKLHIEATHNQHVHFCAKEAGERLFGTANDWLVFVEGGIENQGDRGQRTKGSRNVAPGLRGEAGLSNQLMEK